MGNYQMKLPELGEGIFEGEILKWHIKEGDMVSKDDLLAEVQNDKAVVELHSPISGKVLEIKVEEGDVSTIEDVILVFEVNKEDKSISNEDSATQKKISESKSTDEQTKSSNSYVRSSNQGLKATPVVRKLARQLDVDLRDVKATGKNGRITREDVEQFSQEVKNTNQQNVVDENQSNSRDTKRVDITEQETRKPIKGIRKVISEAMVKSKFTAPHVTVMDEINVEKLIDLRTEAKSIAEKRGNKITYLPFIIKALIAASKQYPVLNSSIDVEKEELVYKNYYNIGIATDTDRGLLVPVINSAEEKNMWKISEEIADLSTRAREGKLAPNELKNSTISITNIGSIGGMFFTPIINYPEVAILGVGKISDKAIVVNKEVVVAPIMSVSLSFDHRVIDGSTAQNFLNYFKEILENPKLLMLEI